MTITMYGSAMYRVTGANWTADVLHIGRMTRVLTATVPITQDVVRACREALERVN